MSRHLSFLAPVEALGTRGNLSIVGLWDPAEGKSLRALVQSRDCYYTPDVHYFPSRFLLGPLLPKSSESARTSVLENVRDVHVHKLSRRFKQEIMKDLLGLQDG